MKVLTIGDPHFKADNVLACKHLHSETEILLKNETPDVVVVLGDILHTHEKINMHCLCSAIDYLKMLQNYCVETNGILIILIGNHDRSNQNVFMTDDHAFKALDLWEATYVVWKTTEINFKKFKFIAVPYVSPGRFMEALSGVENFKSADLILAHQEFKGAKMGIILSEEGDSWDPDFPLVVSGHIHDYSVINENIIYTGTPMQHGFNENLKKTVSVFTLIGNADRRRFDSFCLSLKLPMWGSVSKDSSSLRYIKYKDASETQASRSVKYAIEKRIELRIPKKFQFVLTCPELLEYTHNNLNQVKIKVKVQSNIEYNKILKLEKVKELIQEGVVITPLIEESPGTSSSSSTEETKYLTFKENLENELKRHSKSVFDLYTQIVSN